MLMPGLPVGLRPSYPDGTIPPCSLWQSIGVLDDVSDPRAGASSNQILLTLFIHCGRG